MMLWKKSKKKRPPVEDFSIQEDVYLSKLLDRKDELERARYSTQTKSTLTSSTP